jgi:hypothetical protein
MRPFCLRRYLRFRTGPADQGDQLEKTMPTMLDCSVATIETGIAAVKEWQHGFAEPLVRFIRHSVGRRGQAELRNLRMNSSDEYIRDAVTRAVRAEFQADQ